MVGERKPGGAILQSASMAVQDAGTGITYLSVR
jgi:hypothetical protein